MVTVPARDESVTSPGPDTANELGAQLVRFLRAINKAKSLVARHRPDGLEQAAYAVLFYLVHDGPQRASKLAEMLHAEVSTISRQSSSLVKHGLVERRADPQDGRAHLLVPTAKGLRVFEENRRQRNTWLAEVLADWSEEERKTLNRLFDRLNTGIEMHTPRLADSQEARG